VVDVEAIAREVVEDVIAVLPQALQELADRCSPSMPWWSAWKRSRKRQNLHATNASKPRANGEKSLGWGRRSV